MGQVRRCFSIALSLGACACTSLPSETVTVVTEAKGSNLFSLGAPAVTKSHLGQHIAGRVCRLGRNTRLSPPTIRVEHVKSDGRLADVSDAHVAEIFGARDQTCADYHARVSWTLASGDVVRACFEGGKPCPRQSESRAVVKAPAPSAASPD